MVAVFARVGGGIYTKAADTGSDIVGKVEKGIPEDDPRNAAVIADLVGDNVGDVAGMGSDLFESYVESIIATTTIGALAVMAPNLGRLLYRRSMSLSFCPSGYRGLGIIASIIGTFFVRTGEKSGYQTAYRRPPQRYVSTSVMTLSWRPAAVYYFGVDLGIFWAILAGLIAGLVVGEATNYFTSYSFGPVQKIAKAGPDGRRHGCHPGFCQRSYEHHPADRFRLRSPLSSPIKFAGIYGVAIAGVGMLSTLGIQSNSVFFFFFFFCFLLG